MIRLATEADVPAMLEIYAPYVLETAYSFEYAVPTTEEFTLRLRHHTEFCPWLIWEENGRVMGYAYAAPAFERMAYRWCAEISVYLSPQIQGRGVGRNMYAVLEEILRFLGYRVIYAIVTSQNTGSIAFHEALGYRKTAEFENCGYKFSQWFGTVWLEKRVEFREDPLDLPVKWSDIVRNDRIPPNILANLSLS